jgi:hypothetical protein
VTEPAKWPLRCTANPQLPAAAFCAACDQPYSGEFMAVRPEGRAICVACARRDGVRVHGQRPPSPDTDSILRAGWASTLVAILVSPARTLATRTNAPVLPAVAFGLSVTAFGYAATLGWATLLDYPGLVASAQTAFEALDAASNAATAVGLVWALVPVATVLRLFLSALALYVPLAMRRGNNATWADTLRTVCLANGALVLCALPLVGPLAAVVVWIAAVLGWLRLRHRLGPFAAMFVIIPSVLVISLLGPTSLG